LDPILDQPIKNVSVELKSQLQNINFDLNLSPEEKNQLEWKAEHYPSGLLKQKEPFLKNQRHGLATYWHPNGVKYADIPWYRGQKHGRFKLFRQNGSLEQELVYNSGKPHGLLKWYDEKSMIKLRAYYNHGEVLEIIRH
jgi:antitoxin component YwqK of YwqJK toxin-antitoxin module